MAESLRRELEVVELRLGETWEALAAESRINQLGASMPGLRDAIAEHGHFWQTVLMALQTTWFTGVFSLLDKDEYSATLYSVLSKIQEPNNDPVFSTFIPKLDTIRDLYKNYRHKLFGHNDKKRKAYADLFDKDSFTWRQCEDDTLFLDYVWKAVWLSNDGKTVPSEDDARKLHFAHNESVNAVVKHTDTLPHDIVTRHSAQN